VRREAENFSAYSDMSIWTRASSSPNMNSAIARASRVLPTPVGPRKMNEPIGRRGSFNAARERRRARETIPTASSCPTTVFRSSSSIRSSFSVSASSRRDSGIPVHFETIEAISSSVTVTTRSACSRRHVSTEAWSSARLFFSLSRRPAAFSKSCARIASSFWRRTASIRSSSAFISVGRVITEMRAFAPDSSIRSIALSGRNRPVT